MGTKYVIARGRVKGVKISKGVAIEILKLSREMSKTSHVNNFYFLNKLINAVIEIQMKYESDTVQGNI